jgi:predicted kinase
MLVQLSGVPGSGKSSLARGLVRSADFVVVDTDVVKSALIDGGVPVASAGRPTYLAALGLSGDLLAQGRRVLIDSPCRYRDLMEMGQAIAQGAGVRYGFIELWADDVSSLLPRIDARSPRVSQVASATVPVPGTEWEFGTAEVTLREWQAQLVRPEDDWVRLDSMCPEPLILARALDYLGEPPHH